MQDQIDFSFDAWRALASAVLVRAFRDASSTNGIKEARAAGFPDGITLSQDARRFLTGDGARWLVGLLELDPTSLDRAVDDLPPAQFEQLSLL